MEHLLEPSAAAVPPKRSADRSFARKSDTRLPTLGAPLTRSSSSTSSEGPEMSVPSETRRMLRRRIPPRVEDSGSIDEVWEGKAGPPKVRSTPLRVPPLNPVKDVTDLVGSGDLLGDLWKYLFQEFSWISAFRAQDLELTTFQTWPVQASHVQTDPRALPSANRTRSPRVRMIPPPHQPPSWLSRPSIPIEKLQAVARA